MTRIVDVESLPTRTKTNPAFATRPGQRSSWSGNEVRTTYRKEKKWPKNSTIKHEKIGQFLYEMAA